MSKAIQLTLVANDLLLHIGRDNPQHCPRCDGTLLGYRAPSDIQISATVVYRHRRCRLCNHEWLEVYDTSLV